LPARPSSSAMRARSVLICLRSSSILTWSELFCSRRSLFCSKSSSILFSSDSTNPFWLSALSESILSGGIPSLNHDAITWHRGTQRMLRARGQRDSGVSNYRVSANGCCDWHAREQRHLDYARGREQGACGHLSQDTVGAGA